MKKKKIFIYTTAFALAVSGVFSYNAYANTGFLSTGRIEFDNNTADGSDDVIFDAMDFRNLDMKITEAQNKVNSIESSIDEGIGEIVDELNKNPNIDIPQDSVIKLEEIINYISGMSDVPEDTYFYEAGTEGDENIVTYKKVGGKYYRCNAHGIIAQGAGEVDVTQKTLHPYTAATASTKSAGAASYSNGTFYLGNGKTNAIKYREGYGQGWIDGQANVLDNLNVQYIYHEHQGQAGDTPNGCYTKEEKHKHNSSCYTICPGEYNGWWSEDNVWFQSNCSVCNHRKVATDDFRDGMPCEQRTLNCKEGGKITYVLGCGKDTTSIDRVIIDY